MLLGRTWIEDPIRRTFEIFNNWAQGKAVLNSHINTLDSIKSEFDDSAEFYYSIFKAVKLPQPEERKEAPKKESRTSSTQLRENASSRGRVEPAGTHNKSSGVNRPFVMALSLILTGRFKTLSRAISSRVRSSYPRPGSNSPTLKPGVIASELHNVKARQYAKKASFFDLSQEVIEENHRLVLRARNNANFELKHVLWFMPSFNQIFRGGIYTILRIAAHLANREETLNTF